ncbi:unnamed protein product [Agarophyton chilense]|eukprot:gb/GEZJ01002857.1/.p1 GENE.gb/GEZJ01002857.1/~~gb/GEZJ01002857.1/.p1  ORF type:complete len:246 (-),score=42.70 gb/GEZJ01002857.1/:469-1206(-)
MMAISCFFGALMLAVVAALPLEDLAKLNIVKEVEFIDNAVRADLNFQTNSSQVIDQFSVGRGRVTSANLRCSGICKASMSYDFTLNGISSEYLANKDSLFRETLNSSQTTKYDQAKKNYGGGLNVPFLRAVGLNLGGSYSRENVDEASQRLENYDSLADAARSIMESFEMVTVRVWGTMTVASYTAMRSEAVAWVKFAKVTLLDGTQLRVVSASGADVSVTDENGNGSNMLTEDWVGGAEQKTDG